VQQQQNDSHKMTNTDLALAQQMKFALLTLHWEVGSCESFFALESNLESYWPSDSISNRIFESNRPYIPRKL